jgi:hypothetical protein
MTQQCNEHDMSGLWLAARANAKVTKRICSLDTFAGNRAQTEHAERS